MEWNPPPSSPKISPLIALGNLGKLVSDTYRREMGERVLVTKGQSVFDVLWSVSIATDDKFRAPRLDGVEFVETTWE